MIVNHDKLPFISIILSRQWLKEWVLISSTPALKPCVYRLPFSRSFPPVQIWAMIALKRLPRGFGKVKLKNKEMIAYGLADRKVFSKLWVAREESSVAELSSLEDEVQWLYFSGDFQFILNYLVGRVTGHRTVILRPSVSQPTLTEPEAPTRQFMGLLLLSSLCQKNYWMAPFIE